MGILSRFTDIISANINALLDKCEDPAKMIDQYMLNMREDLAEVKKETAGIIAEEKRSRRLLDESVRDIEKYADLAKKALVAGNEEDAKAFIAKKQEIESTNASLQSTYSIAKANADKMRQLHDKLVHDISTLESRRDAVKAKVAVAKTQTKINNIGTSVSKAGATQSAFQRMESKADKMLDSANAMAELNETATDPVDDIESKYGASGSISVDDELAKMKADLGLA
jgi:phage shock protein A